MEKPPITANSQRLTATSLYPQRPTGVWHSRRAVFTAIILALLFAGPFLRMGDQPMFLFNVLERKFIVFGIFIGPQDYWLFGLMMLAFMVFVVLFTVVFGRLWCGWACPQTVFLEMVFRKIEYAIEGDAGKQKLLDKAPWTTDKILKKGTKWAAFLVISFLIGNLLLAYVVGVKELGRIITEPIDQHAGLFSGIVVFTGIFYFNFAWLREQACTVVCPYGRLQSVLLDRNSIVVAYDHGRGEPRGKLRKNTERIAGDCIDCNQCVAVCPTGIDIRRGTQMECINCTACIDACDAIMDRIDFTKGLIRYTSENIIEKNTTRLWTPRVIGYAAICVLLWMSVAFLLLTRNDTQTSLLRAPGSQYSIQPDGTVSNLYTFKIFNKTNRQIKPEVRVELAGGKLLFAGKPDLTLPPAGMVEGSVFINVPQKALKQRKTKLLLSVFDENKKLETFETTFLGPEE